MFKVNDYVVYGSTGVCQITDIIKGEYMNDESEYYVLNPVYDNNMTIKIPVNNALMRPILTKDEVLSLIETMPEMEPAWIDDQRERNNTYKLTLKSQRDEELIKIIKALHLQKQAKAAINKKLTRTDESLMNAAEKQLHEEFSVALNISPDEVLPFILEYISHLEKNTATAK